MSTHKWLLLSIIFISIYVSCIIDHSHTFGYEHRKKAIEKCSDGIEKIVNLPYNVLTYDYVMTHCLNLSRNESSIFKPKIRVFSAFLFFKSNHERHRIVQNYKKFPNNNTAKLCIQKYNISDDELKILYNCLMTEQLSKTFFYLRTISVKENPREEKELFKFYLWLKTNGALFEKIDIYIDTETGMRGVYVLDDLQFNENLIYIPEKLILQSKNLEQSILIRSKIRRHYNNIKEYDSVILALFLLQEAFKENSFWKPFIDILPGDMSTFPIFYTENELNLLKGYRLYSQVEKIKTRLKKYYDDYICPAGKGVYTKDYCSVISFEVFLWAVVTIKSRAFGVTKDRFEIGGIIPLADLLNHNYFKASLIWRYSFQFKGFIIYSVTDIHHREELLTSYGRDSNEFLLLYYGFISENNPFNEIHIRITLPEDDENYYLKFVLLKKRGLKSSRKMPLSFEVDSTKTIEFINFFRFIHYNGNLLQYLDLQYDLQNKIDKDHKLKRTLRNNKNTLIVDYLTDNKKDNEEYNFDPFHFAPVLIEEEIEMLRKFNVTLNEVLEEFSTRLEEDEQIYTLNKEFMSVNIRNIFVYKITQKQVIKFYMNFCDKMTMMLNMNYNQYMKYIRENREELKPYEFYLETTIKYLLSIYRNS